MTDAETLTTTDASAADSDALPKAPTGISGLDEHAKRLCAVHLTGRYDLSVFATPTFIKAYPLPKRRFVGDLSDTDRVLRALDLTPEATA